MPKGDNRRGKPPGNAFDLGNDIAIGPGNPNADGSRDAMDLLQQVHDKQMMPTGLWRWARVKGWNAGRTTRAINKMRAELALIASERARDVSNRLMLFIENELAEHCTEYITGTGGSDSESGSKGTVILTNPYVPVDPVTGLPPPLTRRNHVAIQGYLKIIMRLHGLDKIVVETRRDKRPLERLTISELIALAEAEEAAEAEPAQGVHVHNEESE